jgi:transcriptional regulator with XRE-family HTH domain
MTLRKKAKYNSAEIDFGNALNRIRKAGNLSNKQIARALGFKSDSMVSHFHAGRHVPSKDDVQVIRALLPSQKLKFMLDDAYVAYCLAGTELLDRYDSHEAQAIAITDLIEVGQSDQAIRLASELWQESFDADFRSVLEDILAEVFFRTEQLPRAIELAQAIAKDEMRSPLARQIRSRGLLGIVLRGTNVKKHVQCASIEIQEALSLFRTNRSAVVGIPDIQEWYELMLEVESVLTRLKLTEGSEREMIARGAIRHFERRLRSNCTVREAIECLEAIGRCALILATTSLVSDVLSEIKKYPQLPRSFAERFQLLDGEKHVLQKRLDEAAACFEQALELSEAWNNRHHARVASGKLISLKLT